MREPRGQLAKIADTITGTMRRRQRDREPAMRAGGAARLGRRHAIGNDDEAAHRTELHGLESKPAQLIIPTSE